MGLLYKPNHPWAMPNGFINSEEYYYYLSLEKDNLHMTKPGSNQKVYIGYISDEMSPTRHMCNSKLYTSKKKFRDETKARGCIEVGNETSTLLKKRPYIKLTKEQRVAHIKEAIRQLANGDPNMMTNQKKRKRRKVKK